MASDEQVLSQAAKDEIAAAVRIVASDKSYQRIQAMHDKLLPPTPETDPPKNGEPAPPPKKEEPEGDPPKPDTTGGGLWWHPERMAE